MITRKFKDNDLTEIEKIDMFAAIQIKYHGGIQNENIICAVEKNKIIGFGFLTLKQGIKPKGKQEIGITTKTAVDYAGDNRVNNLLTDAIKRFQEIKESDCHYACLQVFVESDEIKKMQFYLEKGFALSGVMPVLQYDLSQPINRYVIPEEIVIKELPISKQTLKEYLEADYEAMDDIDNEADLYFRTGGGNFKRYAAFADSKIVGAVSTWDLTEERAASENVFVIPEFRKRTSHGL